MSTLWMPGVERRDTGRRLTMRGTGPRIFTWHTFEAPYSLTKARAFEVLDNNRSDPHFVFNPVAGWIFQMLPANTGGRTLRAKDPRTGQTASTNTWGTVHMQIEVIGYAARPWTSDLTPAGLDALQRLMDFLRSWGIPDQWCHNVRPPKYPGPGVPKRQPTMSGHYHHAGWPVNDHGDPGLMADPWTIAKAVEVVDQLTEYAEALLALGYPATPEGVRAYQAANTGAPHNLAVDGILGPKTATALEADMATLQDLEAAVGTVIAAIDTGMDSAENREGVGTGRDLTLGELARLNAARINTQRARHWDLVRAISASSTDPRAVGVAVADAIRGDIVDAIREAGSGADTEAVIAEIRSRLEPEDVA